MTTKATVTGLDKLRQALEKRLTDIKAGKGAVVVGYTQKYALAVHENTSPNVKWTKPGTGPKYLEGPARRFEGELKQIIRESAKEGDLAAGLLRAGLRLQRESQAVVPLDTGALRASAFTAYEGEAEMAAAEAFAKSEAVRQAEKGTKKK